MKTNEDRIQHLERRVIRLTFVSALLFLIIVGAAGLIGLNSTRESIYALSVNWQPDGGLRFTTSSDGPFIVTHLEHGFNTSEVRTTKLPEPIIIVDSFGAELSKKEVERLKWRDYRGRPIAAPKQGAEIKAFYFRPKVAVGRR